MRLIGRRGVWPPPAHTAPYCLDLYTSKKHWGKGKGCNNTCTQPVNPTVTEILKQRPLQRLKPKSSHPVLFIFDNQTITPTLLPPHPSLSILLSPQNHRSFLLVSIQLYNIHAQKKKEKKSAPSFQQEVLVFNILRTSGALEHTQEPSEVTVKLFFFSFCFFREKTTERQKKANNGYKVIPPLV